jgi:hypothetical protein
VNEKGKVLEVSGEDAENKNIVMANSGTSINQQWEIIYVDEYSEPKKGELNEQFGLFVERDFYIVS